MDSNPYAAPQAEGYQSVVAPAGPGSCPLCGEIKLMKRAKRLYGHEVCPRCAHAFANRRQFAYAIDTALMIGAYYTTVFGIAGVAVQSQWTEEQFIQFQRITSWVFGIVFVAKDSFSGYSLGKYLTGVRVIDARTGIPTGLKGSILRNLPLVIPFIPLVVAFTMMKGKRVGDGWAHTKVVWNRFADSEVFQPNEAPAMG
ncbi:MAG: RDD family protein [Pirellulales bacterium]